VEMMPIAYLEDDQSIPLEMHCCPSEKTFVFKHVRKQWSLAHLRFYSVRETRWIMHTRFFTFKGILINVRVLLRHIPEL
jgi:hypothetical protein